MQQDLGSILAYALYFIVLFAIGLYHMKDTGAELYAWRA